MATFDVKIDKRCIIGYVIGTDACYMPDHVFQSVEDAQAFAEKKNADSKTKKWRPLGLLAGWMARHEGRAVIELKEIGD